jgi:hypothetical protein
MSIKFMEIGSLGLDGMILGRTNFKFLLNTQLSLDFEILVFLIPKNFFIKYFKVFQILLISLILEITFRYVFII